MKRLLCALLAVLLLAGCGKAPAQPETTEPEIAVPDVTEPETTEPETTEPETTEPETTEPETTEPETTEPETTEPETTEPETTEPETTEPEHSPLYIEGIPVEDVICWFNEVALDAEFFTGSGDATLVQKWKAPILFAVHGEYSEEDWATLARFTQWLNTIEGFPGISEAEDSSLANVHIHFTDEQGFLDTLGPDYVGLDGGITFWYTDNIIYDEVICIRTDIDQQVRNSVIMEEIYNGLGPVQDTLLREDSLIWQGYSWPQELTQVDELILKLLYHPDIGCGMNASECEAVIRTLYY